MKTRTALLVGLVLIAAGGGAWWWQRQAAEVLSWRTVELLQQDVRATVSSTGTLAAVTTVKVGTQVSGTVQALLVDFNDKVKAGQVIARIDTSLLQADVDAVRATLAVRGAEEDKARGDLARVESLHGRGAASDQDLSDARTTLAVAQAQVKAAQVSLDRATRNLGYATITSPVDGTVLSRDVDAGQTVNAGMTAPQLFVIAGDLTRMQALVTVDESDIGRIHEGQAVEFTVQAYAADTFRGVVQQVRLQSTVSENVVTYTVVVDVDNTDGRLLPGMTATVKFVVGEAKDVLCAPNAALRFRPAAAAGADAGATTRGVGGPPSGPGGAGGPPAGGAGGPPAGGRGAAAGGTATLYTVGSDDALVPHPVVTGLTDGRCTEVTGEGLSAGLLLVSGQESSGAGSATGGGTTNPLQPKSGGGGPPRPGGF